MITSATPLTAPRIVDMPITAVTALTDGWALGTDSDARTSVLVDTDASDCTPDRVPVDTGWADWDGWQSAEDGRLRRTDERGVDARDLADIAEEHGPCVVTRLPAETWDADDTPSGLLGTVLAVRPLTVDEGRRILLDPDVRGMALCPGAAARLDDGERLPGTQGPLTRICTVADGTCDACGAAAEGPWDGYGLYAPATA